MGKIQSFWLKICRLSYTWMACRVYRVHKFIMDNESLIVQYRTHIEYFFLFIEHITCMSNLSIFLVLDFILLSNLFKLMKLSYGIYCKTMIQPDFSEHIEIKILNLNGTAHRIKKTSKP